MNTISFFRVEPMQVSMFVSMGGQYALPNRFGTASRLASLYELSMICSLTKYRSWTFGKFLWIGIRGWQYIASTAIVSKASNFGTTRETFLLNGSNSSRGHTMQAILLDWNQVRTQFEPFSRVHHGLLMGVRLGSRSLEKHSSGIRFVELPWRFIFLPWVK